MTLFEIVGISNSDRNSDLYWIVWNLEFLPSSGSLVDALHSVNFYSPFIRMFKGLSLADFSKLVSGCSALGWVERSMELLRMRQELFPSEAVQASPSFRL